jgi:hypothetical protein
VQHDVTALDGALAQVDDVGDVGEERGERVGLGKAVFGVQARHDENVVDDDGDVAGVVLSRAARRLAEEGHLRSAAAQQVDQAVLLGTDGGRRVRPPGAGGPLAGQNGMDVGAVEVGGDVAGVAHGDVAQGAVFAGGMRGEHVESSWA